MILPDGAIRVDFVIDLPVNKVGEWFGGIMPGAHHGIADEIDEDDRLKVSKDNIEIIKRNLVIQFRYYTLSEGRTEVRAYCSRFFRVMLDERLVLVGRRFPEARLDICEAMNDDATARLLPKTVVQCNTWLEDKNGSALGATDPLVLKVIELLRSGFNMAELREICDRIGVDDEDYPREKKDFVSALTKSMNRSGRLGELLDIGRELRPHLEWPQITK